MAQYSRPSLPLREFRDAGGHLIPYGDRWPDGDAPENTYEVVSHPERFDPLHTIADALIDHLVTEYDVTVDNEQDPARPAFRRADDRSYERCARLIPADPSAASLTFLFHSFPSVTIHAGLLHWEPFPGCGCDHCDETAEGAADALEQLVFAVTDVGFGERLSADSPPEHRIEIRSADGEVDQTVSGIESHMTVEEADRVRTSLDALGGRWAAWPRRARSSV